MARAKPSQSQSLALAVGLTLKSVKPRPPQAKPEHHYLRASTDRQLKWICCSDHQLQSQHAWLRICSRKEKVAPKMGEGSTM